MRLKQISVLAAALLLTGCAESTANSTMDTAETTAPVTEAASAVTEPDIPAEPVDTSGWTEDELRSISDGELIALGRDPYALGLPAVCDYLPPGLITRLPLLVETASAADLAEADAIVTKRIGGELAGQQPVAEDDEGRWWHYYGSSGVSNDLLIFNKEFLDMETAVLHAEVTAENLLLLTAIQCYDKYFIPCLGAFVEDEGDSFRCTQYYLHCVGGDDGMSDTAAVYAYTFTADKETGALEGYPFEGLPDSRAELIKEIEIPGTYHSEENE